MLMEVAQEPPLDRDRIVRGNFIALLFLYYHAFMEWVRTFRPR